MPPARSRRARRRRLLVAAVLVASASATAALLYAQYWRRPRTKAPEVAVRRDPPVPMEFSKGELASRITQDIERVVSKGRVQVAQRPPKGPRWFCIVVDAQERLYDLDLGMKPEDVPGLLEGGFKPVPPQMTRTTSIYRAIAKRAVPEFRELSERVVVVLCPGSEWPKLALHWPPRPR